MNEIIKEFDDAIDDIFNNEIDIEKYQKLKQLFLAKLKEERIKILEEVKEKFEYLKQWVS